MYLVKSAPIVWCSILTICTVNVHGTPTAVHAESGTTANARDADIRYAGTKQSYALSQTERGETTTATAEGTSDSVVFDVRSKSGIGRMTITPDGGEWSDDVTLRLYLRGLELFQVDNGKHTVVSASSRGPEKRSTYVTPSSEGRKEDLKNLVTKKHELFVTVSEGKDGGGRSFFEVRLPAALFKNQPEEIRIRWIDFYRG